MRPISILTSIPLLLFAINSTADLFSDIEFITENYPPYNYEENNLAAGISVEILLQAAQEAGQPISREHIHVRPWARGYRQALIGPKVMLFSMARTPDREANFQWVGPIMKIRIAAMAKKENAINIGTVSDFTRYAIGTVRDDAGEQVLKKLDVNSELNAFQVSPTPQVLVKKLNLGRIEIMVLDEIVAHKVIEAQGLSPKNFEVVYILKYTESYFAFSKDVSRHLVQALQTGLDKLKTKNGGKDYENLIHSH
ncbi:MAG: transporter substrate-binding domain-containing protein [Bermanella sp.]